jgi:hypothetical protein
MADAKHVNLDVLPWISVAVGMSGYSGGLAEMEW